jgi:hypothetical protein
LQVVIIYLQIQQKGEYWGEVIDNKWVGASFAVDDFHASRIKFDGTSMQRKKNSPIILTLHICRSP